VAQDKQLRMEVGVRVGQKVLGAQKESGEGVWAKWEIQEQWTCECAPKEDETWNQHGRDLDLGWSQDKRN